MRSLTLALLLGAISSCTCGGCLAAPGPDAGTAGLPRAGAQLAIADAGRTAADTRAQPPLAGLAAVDSGAAADDGGDELTWEISQTPPDPEALVAAFAADCRYAPKVVFEDMNGTEEAGECEARAFDQNCAPDTFGCWEATEKCRDGCAGPCTSCTAQCADACDGCKRGCDGGACARSCAVARSACRVSCLHRLHTCRTQDCQATLDACEADAAARTRRQCPDCEALRDCESKAMGASTDPAACAAKFPKNAAECLEWCSP